MNENWAQVLNDRLKDREWLAADQYSIADIANFSWVGPCADAVRDDGACCCSGYWEWHGHLSECSAAWPELIACMSIAEGLAEDRAWREEMSFIAPQVFCYFWAGATIDDKPHLKG